MRDPARFGPLVEADFDKPTVPAYGHAAENERRDSIWHEHPRFHQITLALSGASRFEDPERCWTLPPGRVAFVPARHRHRIRASGPGSLRLIFLDRDHYPLGIDTVRVANVPALAREMIAYASRWGLLQSDFTDFARDFFCVIHRLLPEWMAAPLPLSLPRPQSSQIERVVEYLNANLEAPRFTDAARRAGMSTRTLTRCFRSEMRMTWRGYLQGARVLAAIHLLALPGARVTEVATSVGFSSPASFSQAFRSLLGVSPLAFRQAVLVRADPEQRAAG
jgi:AraC-like DNA-binding protein/mannose-6-phosphate isomerase-like protein (cupin superfamily)